MITSAQCLKKYGPPAADNKWLVLCDVPTHLEIGIIPKRIYCNKDLVKPLEQAFKNLIDRGYVKELKTWDGCFNIRKKRGLSSMSLHSWGLAVDCNSSHNQLGKTREQLIKEGFTPFTDGFGQCFIDAGFNWGKNWKRADLMHFELAKI